MTSKATKPGAFTKEEVREAFLNRVHAAAQYWAATPGVGDISSRCDGVAFSILTLIDGSTGDFPAVNLSVQPHPDDKQFAISQGRKYFAPSMVFNDDVHLHDIYYTGARNKEAPKPVEAADVETGNDLFPEFDHLYSSISTPMKALLLPIRLASNYMENSFVSPALKTAFWAEFGKRLGAAIAAGSVGEIGDIRVVLYQVQDDAGGYQLQLTALRVEDEELGKPNAFGFIVTKDVGRAYLDLLEQGRLVKLFHMYALLQMAKGGKRLVLTGMDPLQA